MKKILNKTKLKFFGIVFLISLVAIFVANNVAQVGNLTASKPGGLFAKLKGLVGLG